MLRRKEDGKLKAVEKLSWTKRKITFLDALGTELFPWPTLGLFSLLEKLWALFLKLLWLRWALLRRHSRRRSLVPGFTKPSSMALPWRNVELVLVSLRHHHREPYTVLRNVGALLLSSCVLFNGNFAGIGN